MANKYLLCLSVFCIALLGDSVNGKYGGGRSFGKSFSRWGSGSKPKVYIPHTYPSSSGSGSRWSGNSNPSSWLSGGSSSSSYLGGLSGSSSGSKYPPSWGLSGSNSGRLTSLPAGVYNSGSGSKYPPSNGLSGSGGSSKYPPSSGLSGSTIGRLTPLPAGVYNSFSGSKYPSLNGLSGSRGSSKYPPSSGLSGSTIGRPSPLPAGVSAYLGSESKYPPSNGLSGSGGGSKYPPYSGLSGSTIGRPLPAGVSAYLGSDSKYPPSNGLSGSGGGRKPSSGLSDIGKPHNNYNQPTSLGTSNYNTHNLNTNYHKPEHYHPSTSHNSHSGYRPTHNTGSYGSNVYVPTYYTSPQYVYIAQYRDSGSRYNDLLTGLTLYNLGRSNSHYNHHYYYDDYYRRRYDDGSSSIKSPTVKTSEVAHCLLRVKESGKVDELKIPCEIVSTFTEGSKKEAQDTIRVENTVCQNYTILSNNSTTTSSSILNSTVSTSITESSLLSVIPVNSGINKVNSTELPRFSSINSTTPSPYLTNSYSTENYFKSSTTTSPEHHKLISELQNRTSITLGKNTTAHSTNATQITSNITTGSNESSTITSPVNFFSTIKPINVSSIKTNIVNCTTTIISKLKDPLTIKGPPLRANNMECEVEIVTKDHRLRSKVDCKTLIEYSKMPEPKKNTGILPSRDKLKSWLAKPPWWMSLFVAV